MAPFLYFSNIVNFDADNVFAKSSTKVSPKTFIAIKEVWSDHNIVCSSMFGIFLTGLGKATKTFGPGSW